ncbi:hypothetical protein ACXHXM_36210
MTSATDFIAELIRAANETDTLTVHEISRLLDRSIDSERDEQPTFSFVNEASR